MKYRMKKTLLVTAIVGAVGIGTLFHLMKPAQDAMQLVSNKQASRQRPGESSDWRHRYRGKRTAKVDSAFERGHRGASGDSVQFRLAGGCKRDEG